MNKEIQSRVNIRKSGNGYIIEVADKYTENSLLAITREELELIILIGEKLLKDNT